MQRNNRTGIKCFSLAQMTRMEPKQKESVLAGNACEDLGSDDQLCQISSPRLSQDTLLTRIIFSSQGENLFVSSKIFVGHKAEICSWRLGESGGVYSFPRSQSKNLLRSHKETAANYNRSNITTCFKSQWIKTLHKTTNRSS